MATAAAPKLTFIPDILETHVEEAAFLWGRRANALRSPRRSRSCGWAPSPLGEQC